MPDEQPKRLFTVTVETDVVVLAVDEKEAEKIATQQLRHIDVDEWSVFPSDMTYLPSGWDDDCIPYGEGVPEDPDRTIGEWIKLGAAPEYALRNGGPEGSLQ